MIESVCNVESDPVYDGRRSSNSYRLSCGIYFRNVCGGISAAKIPVVLEGTRAARTESVCRREGQRLTRNLGVWCESKIIRETKRSCIQCVVDTLRVEAA